FTTPASISTLRLIMYDNVPGGCGNDFALDDITFRECVIQKTQPTVTQKTQPIKKTLTVSKPVPKKVITPSQKIVQELPATPDSSSKPIAVVKQAPAIIIPPPLILITRENALASKIETETG